MSGIKVRWIEHRVYERVFDVDPELADANWSEVHETLDDQTDDWDGMLMEVALREIVNVTPCHA